MNEGFYKELLAAALPIANGSANDPNPLSQLVPFIIERGDTTAIFDLFQAAPTDAEKLNLWLPEALMLFNTPGLTQAEYRAMTAKLLSSDTMSDEWVSAVSRCSGIMGAFGFSFPKWRYLAQGSETPSLLEQFGMHRLRRDSDVLNAALPPSDPNRDRFGAGFYWNENDWYIEYRRAYILCANTSKEKPVAIVIRNNSYFYGRDRLPSPAYISFEPGNAAKLQAIDEKTLAEGGAFLKWQDIAHDTQLPFEEKMQRVESLLDYLQNFDANLSFWLTHEGPSEKHFDAGPDHSGSHDRGGVSALLTFLDQKILAKNPKAILYFGNVRNGMSPWFPQKTVPVTPGLLQEIAAAGAVDKIAPFKEALSENSSIVLLSSENGDFPSLAKRKIPSPSSGLAPEPK